MCMSADRGSKLEQKLMHTEEKLQAEQVAHSKLQADVTLERSQAALIKVTALRASLQGAAGQKGCTAAQTTITTPHWPHTMHLRSSCSSCMTTRGLIGPPTSAHTTKS